jgi:hypothetical protein
MYVAAPDVHKAQKAFAAGRNAEVQRNWEAAFAEYDEALSNSPGSRAYLEARERARFRIVQEHMDRAERAALTGQAEVAHIEVYAALGMDPYFSIARERLAQLQRALPRPPAPRPDIASRLIALQPSAGRKSFDYRGNTQGAYEEIARVFGLTVSFDQDLGSKNIRFRVPDVDFFSAIFMLGVQTDTFLRALSEKTFFVTNDTPEKRKQYEPVISQTVALDASTTPERMNEIRQAVREIAGIANPQIETSTRQLTIAGPPPAVALALELVWEMERAPGEMMLEVGLYEIDRNAARKIGVTPPSSARTFTLTPQDIQEAQSSPEGLLRVLSRVFGSSTAGLGNTSVINPSTLIPPLVAFGGGKSVMLATLPGAQFDFSDALTIVRSARRVMMRAEDAQQATLFVGDRFPISLAVLTPSITSPVVIVAVRVDDYDTGKDPHAVAVGDFDGTGGSDFVVANTQDNTLSVFLNDGTGRFGTPTTIATEDGPRAVLVADFNGDGRSDIVVANQRADTVSVMLGNGDGTFGLPNSLPTLTGPVALASGEFTSDANLDLVVVCENSDSLLLFPGNGDGTFATPIPIATGAAPRAVITGDWNHDNVADLAVANANDNTVTILLGRGAGNFTRMPDLVTGRTPSALATADFNLDTFADLVVTNQDDNSISVFTGVGDGTFNAAADLPTGAAPSGLAAADFTGDGRTDLVLANSQAAALTLLAGNGDGTFTLVADQNISAAAFAITTADFNGDGRADIVTANPDGNTATVVLNNASSTNTPSSNVATSAQSYPGAMYEDIGVKVQATPRMHPGREVSLKLAVDLKSIGASTFNGIPVINSRSIEQVIRLRDGETSVLSGMLTDQNDRILSGWPGLSSLPVAGLAAGSRQRQPQQFELLITITPHLVRAAPRKDRLIYAGKLGEGVPAGSEPPQ